MRRSSRLPVIWRLGDRRCVPAARRRCSPPSWTGARSEHAGGRAPSILQLPSLNPSGMVGSPKGDKLPRILVGAADLKCVTEQAWEALQQANRPPRLFRYGGLPARIESDDHDLPIVRPLNVDRVRHEIARA